MKAEITQENKAKFFAQHWGQNVLSSDMYGDNGTIYSLTMKEDSLNDKWLLLKPLSSISDEDAKHIMYGKNAKEALHYYGNDIEYWIGKLTIYEYQYLQSKGYALPWMGLSVEEMVEYGWIKLLTW